MKANKDFGIHDGGGAKQGLLRRRRPAMLVPLMGGLMLAIALSSVSLAAGSAAAPDLERSNEASAMRWAKLGEAYESAASEAAAVTMSQRYKAMATYYGADSAGVESGPDADAARWTRLAEVLAATRAEAAAVSMTNRYKALAEYCDGQPVTPRALLCSADYGSFEP